MRGEDLETDGELATAVEIGAAARDGNAGNTREIGGESENIRKIFLDAIGGNAANFASRGGSDGSKDGIDLLEGIFKIATDQGADFLSATVIGVVVAGRKHVGAENDPAFDFWAKTLFARFLIEVEDIGGFGGTLAVANAVEAGKIRGGFSSGDDVISSDGILGVGQRDFDNFGSLRGESLNRSFDVFADAGVDAFAKILFGNTEFKTLDAVVEVGEVIWNFGIEAGRVEWVAAGDDLEDAGGVLDGLGERADLVEG